MSDAAKMEPWRADAERRDCYCATQRKPCPYHEGYGDGWDAGSDAVLAVLPPNGWEQVGWSCVENRDHFSIERPTTPWAAGHLWEPVYRRVVPVVPSPEPEPSEFDAALRLERLRQGLCEHGRRMVDDCLYCIRPAVASPELEPLRCESCGELADVRLDDGSTWCVSCDGSARNLGYDEHPVKTWIDRPAVASPDRCLTCGSDDADKLGDVPYGGVTCLCDDPWHRVPSTEGDQ